MEKALLIHPINNESSDFEEFKELVKACELEASEIITQNIKTISFRTYIGSGKAIEIKSYLQDDAIDVIVFSCDLTPLQLRNLEELWDVPILDRSSLILEIFYKRAISSVSRMQIESAMLKRELPRLVGAHANLGRQRGGKNKGAGEKQIDLDKRRIKQRISELDRALKEEAKKRMTQRSRRIKKEVPLVSLVGYTNAGKSTIMNSLLKMSDQEDEKQVFEKNMLFATLDTHVRNIHLPSKQPFLCSDTVGFVSDLPHELVQAFHSTLEEIQYATLLLHVVDATSEDSAKQMEITKDTLHTIEADHIPSLTIYNKCDQTSFTYPKRIEDTLYICAKEESSIQLLTDAILSKLFPDEVTLEFLIPYEFGNLVSRLREEATILNQEYKETGTYIQAVIQKRYLKSYEIYVIQS